MGWKFWKKSEPVEEIENLDPENLMDLTEEQVLALNEVEGVTVDSSYVDDKSMKHLSIFVNNGLVSHSHEVALGMCYVGEVLVSPNTGKVYFLKYLDKRDKEAQAEFEERLKRPDFACDVCEEISSNPELVELEGVTEKQINQVAFNAIYYFMKSSTEEGHITYRVFYPLPDKVINDKGRQDNMYLCKFLVDEKTGKVFLQQLQYWTEVQKEDVERVVGLIQSSSGKNSEFWQNGLLTESEKEALKEPTIQELQTAVRQRVIDNKLFHDYPYGSE